MVIRHHEIKETVVNVFKRVGYVTNNKIFCDKGKLPEVQPTVDDRFATLAYIDSGNDVGN